MGRRERKEGSAKGQASCLELILHGQAGLCSMAGAFRSLLALQVHLGEENCWDYGRNWEEEVEDGSSGVI